MSSVIPYVPGLAIGGVVDISLLNNLIDVSKAQALIDAAQDKLNSFISMKKSLDMTIQELIGMGLDPVDLSEQSYTIGTDITAAALEYVQIRLAQELKIQSVKAAMPQVSQYISPVDFDATRFKEKLPLSANSLKMDSQYFAYESNTQTDKEIISKIKKYISEQTNPLGTDNSEKVSTAVTDQIDKQRENHNVEGTIIITATCTHKDAILLSPLVLDADRAVMVWNDIYEDDQITESSVEGMPDTIASKDKGNGAKSISILSGATFGSCFIGMVHILKSENTSTGSMKAIAQNLEEKGDIGLWWQNKKGGVGMDPTFEKDMKGLLSTSALTSHITIVSMGIIPSIVSNQVQTSVKEFGKFNPEEIMEQLGLTGDTPINTIENESSTAQQRKRVQEINNLKLEALINVLSHEDKDSNQVLNITSMMKAFEDYIKKASENSAGVPINYYLTKFTRAQVVEMWRSKYSSKKYLSSPGINNAQKDNTVKSAEVDDSSE